MSDEACQLCIFRIGPVDYAVDLRRVEEIVAVPKLTPLPLAPPGFEGVVNLHGAVFPVVDARKRLGAEISTQPRERKRERLMVCRIGHRRVGLIVDAVSNVLRVPKAQLRPAPSLGTNPIILGVYGEHQDLKLLLDIIALFEEA
jgi:purine-binding chemotaxis protein CheW